MKRRGCYKLLIALTVVGWGAVLADLPGGADFDTNGRVDLVDFAVMSSSWGKALPWWPDGQLHELTAHWPLDGDAQDSQFLFDGVCVGSAAWYTKKNNPDSVKVGSGAIGFSGPGYIEIDAARFPPFFESFTLDAWVKTGYTAQEQMVICNGGDSWQLGVAAMGRVFLSCPGLSGHDFLSGNTPVCDDRWHHIAGVYDCSNQQLLIYVDSTLDGQIAASGQVRSNNSMIWIGDDPEAQDGQWCGILDNVRVFNYALNLQQVFGRQTYHVDAVNGMDVPGSGNPDWGRGRQQAFKTIQHAIDVASDGDTILVWPGIYRESLFFMGKGVTIRSAADAAWLMPNAADPDQIAVTFMYGEEADSVLEHFVILNSQTALWLHQSSPTLRHLTVVRNTTGMETIFNALPEVEHCIFRDNGADIVYDTYAPQVSYSCMQSSWAGEGNICADPRFGDPNNADPNGLDFHLRSQAGRFVPGEPSQAPLPENWIADAENSPCIDAGRPDINPFREGTNNGGRINMGAYGNTPFASRSAWALAGDMNCNGQVQLEDILLFSEQWLKNGDP